MKRRLPLLILGGGADQWSTQRGSTVNCILGKWKWNLTVDPLCVDCWSAPPTPPGIQKRSPFQAKWELTVDPLCVDRRPWELYSPTISVRSTGLQLVSKSKYEWFQIIPLLCKKSSKSPLSTAIPASVLNPNSSNACASLSACKPNAGLWLVYTAKLK